MKGGINMTGYIVGSQKYYEKANERLVEIEDILTSNKLDEDEKERLLDERLFILCSFKDNY